MADREEVQGDGGGCLAAGGGGIDAEVTAEAAAGRIEGTSVDPAVRVVGAVPRPRDDVFLSIRQSEDAAGDGGRVLGSRGEGVHERLRREGVARLEDSV